MASAVTQTDRRLPGVDGWQQRLQIRETGLRVIQTAQTVDDLRIDFDQGAIEAVLVVVAEVGSTECPSPTCTEHRLGEIALWVARGREERLQRGTKARIRRPIEHIGQTAHPARSARLEDCPIRTRHVEAIR